MKDKISVIIIISMLFPPMLKFVLIHFMLGPIDINRTKGIRKGNISLL